MQNPGILPSVAKLSTFLAGVPALTIDGFHSQFFDRIKKNHNSLIFQQAKSICFNLESRASKIRKNWKHSEVQLLLYVVDKACLLTGTDFIEFDQEMWARVSEMIPGRDWENCKSKMLSLVPINLNELPWTEAQQDILAELIQELGVTKWKDVSLKLFQSSPTHIYRSSKQCRERYMCYLKPNLKKGFWSEEQDYQLIKLFLKYGRKWSKMTQFIEGRNENAIKNRFFLLFQWSRKSDRLYHSQFMRKVLRRKQKLQKSLSISSKTSQKVESAKNQPQVSETHLIQQNSCSQSDFIQHKQMLEIQKFFAF